MPPRSVKLQKNPAKVLTQKVVTNAVILNLSYVQFFQNINFNRLNFGITGLPVKIKKFVIEFFLDCLMQKSVWKYLALLNYGIGA